MSNGCGGNPAPAERNVLKTKAQNALDKLNTVSKVGYSGVYYDIIRDKNNGMYALVLTDGTREVYLSRFASLDRIKLIIETWLRIGVVEGIYGD